MPLAEDTKDTSLTGLGIVLPNATVVQDSSSSNHSVGFPRAPNVTNGNMVLKSSLRMRSLSNVESGGSMVAINIHDHVSGFKEGSVIHLDDEETIQPKQGSSSRRPIGSVRSRSASHLILHQKQSMAQSTSHSESDSSSELSSKTSFSSLRNPNFLELDLQLENNTVVEGSSLNGSITISNRTKSPVLLAGPPKIRVIGFEVVSNDRHTFFHHSSLLELASPSLKSILASSPQLDGFKAIPGGKHPIPFSFHIPRSLGVRGSVTTRSHVNVRYIILISFNCRDNSDPVSTKRIAHFYRACHLFPLLDPARVLVSDPLPLTRSSSKSLFLGGPGKLKMTCMLHRTTWVAGQQCWIRVRLCNDTTKRVKSLAFTLYRHTTTFKMMPQLNPGDLAEIDIDSCITSTSRRKLVHAVLEGTKGPKDAVSGKGWWCGVEAKSESSVVYGILLPPDALTITRIRLLEINYVLGVTAHTASLTTDLNVELPITIVNFISLYPPPSSVEISSLGLNTESQHLAADRDLHARRLPRRHSSHDESIPSSLRSLYGAENQYLAISQSHATNRPRPQPKEYRRSLPDTRSLSRIANLNVSDQAASATGDVVEMSRVVQYRPSTLDTCPDSDEEVDRLIQSTPLRDCEMDPQSSSSTFGAKCDFTPRGTTSHSSRSETYTDHGPPHTLPLGKIWNSGARNERPAPLGPRSRSQPQRKSLPITSCFQPPEIQSEDYASENDHSTLSGCPADYDDRPTKPIRSTDGDTCRTFVDVAAVKAELVPVDSPCTASAERHIKTSATPTNENPRVSPQSLRCHRPASKLLDSKQTGSGFRLSTSVSIQERIAKLEMAGLGANR